MRFGYGFFVLLPVIFLLSGCAGRVPVPHPPPVEALFPVRAADVDFSDDLDNDSLNAAIERSLHYYNRIGDHVVYRLAGRLVTRQQMIASLLAFRQIMREEGVIDDRNKRISRDFDVYRATGQDGRGTVLFTGYYVPVMEGSLTRTDKYKYPLYKPPPDLADGNNAKDAYYSRKEIDANGVLQGKNLEIAWVADPIELFFLHIQGSGELKLENGDILTVSVAGTNGRSYRSVPGYLLEKGIISARDASNRNIKRFLKGKNESDLYEILGFNERYIFFNFAEKATGSLGEPVTSGRTIATDPEMFPPGALAFVKLRKPLLDQEGNPTKQKMSLARFVLNQDKGDAIRGPGRVDLFCGFGGAAESMAETLKEKGELYFLVKKQ